MELPIRVLHVFGCMNVGGAESRTMDLYRNINRDLVQFDFLVHTVEKCFFDNEILKMGGKIYSVPRLSPKTLFTYIKAVDQFFTNHPEYMIVHGHITSTGIIYQWIAKKHGIPVRIGHARSADYDNNFLGKIKKAFERPLRFVVTHQFAVSRLAGLNLFGKRNLDKNKIKVIPNAIDVEKFSYNESIRSKLRDEIGIKDNFVIGHVGRLTYAKNHNYLVKILKEIYKKNNNVRLLLVGDGELFAEIKEQVKSLGLSEAVIFLGSRSDVPLLLQAMDLFVFPSHYEGLPGTVIEAQAAGLKCIVSDRVTNEVAITSLVKFLPIDVSPEIWANAILELTCGYSRRSWIGEISKAGFDVKEQAKKMEEFYLSCAAG